MIETTNTELKMLDKAAREYARKALKPDREENDKFPYGDFFNVALDKAFEAGFLHTVLPDSFGGLGRDLAPLCLILHQISQEDASMGGIILTNAVVQELFQSAGCLEMIEVKVKGAESAEKLLVAYPLFHNPNEIDRLPVARKVADAYQISGSVDFVALGGIAEHAIVPGVIEGESDYSLFFIDLTLAEGIEKSDTIFSLGLHACPAVDLTLKAAKCYPVGEPGKGNVYFEAMYHRMLLAAAAMSAGIMKSSFDEALDYSRKRLQGGREIINWSEIRMMLANLAHRLKISEMSIAQACLAEQEGKADWVESSNAAAFYALDLACDFTSDGIQLLGGYGYTKDFAQEKRFRDAQQLQAVLGLAPMKKLNYIKSMI